MIVALIGVALFICLYLYRKILRPIRRRTTATAIHPGELVAATVRIDKHHILKANADPATVGITLRFGGKETTTWHRAQSLPPFVRRRTVGLIFFAGSPRIPVPDRAEALRQAREGGFRFVLDPPIPVDAVESSSGLVSWQRRRSSSSGT